MTATHAKLRVPRLSSRPVVLTGLQLAFLAWAVVEVARGRPGKALALVAMFLVLQVPRLLRLPMIFDWAFLVAWTLQALGQVAGFWSLIPWWDTLVHGALPAVLAPTGVILLIRAGFLPDLLETTTRRRAIGAAMVVFLVATGFGTAYEFYEWRADKTLGTHYQPSNDDTMTDMTANAVGGILGGVLLVAGAARRGSPA